MVVTFQKIMHTKIIGQPQLRSNAQNKRVNGYISLSLLLYRKRILGAILRRLKRFWKYVCRVLVRTA